MIKKYLKSEVKKNVIFLVFVLSFQGCYQNKLPHKIPGLYLKFSFQFVTEEDLKLLTIENRVGIFYYKDFIFYKIPVKHVALDTIESKVDSFFLDLDNYIVVPEYYIFKKGDSIGYKLDSLQSENFTISKYGSFLSKRNVVVGNEFHHKKNDVLVRQFKNNDTIIQIYIPKIKVDESYCDSSIFYYLPRKNTLQFSFSNELENKKNIEVVKVRLVYNSTVSPDKDSLIIPSREQLLERVDTSIKISEVQKLITFFNSQYQ